MEDFADVDCFYGFHIFSFVISNFKLLLMERGSFNSLRECLFRSVGAGGAGLDPSSLAINGGNSTAFNWTTIGGGTGGPSFNPVLLSSFDCVVNRKFFV